MTTTTPSVAAKVDGLPAESKDSQIFAVGWALGILQVVMSVVREEDQ